MTLKIYIDGGARGNPGPAGFGLVVYDLQNNLVHQSCQFLGIKTNNEAEYSGLINALNWINTNASQLKVARLLFYSDSELVVRQIQGRYKVKAPHLKPLYQTAINLLAQINLPYEFHSVPREQNQLADRLANRAMDQSS